jgi:hypothetical protein
MEEMLPIQFDLTLYIILDLLTIADSVIVNAKILVWRAAALQIHLVCA